MKENRKQPPVNNQNDNIQPNINMEKNPIKQSDISSPQKIHDNQLNELPNDNKEITGVEKKEEVIEVVNPANPNEDSINLRAPNTNNSIQKINNSSVEFLEDKLKYEEENEKNEKGEEGFEPLLEIDDLEYIPNFIGKLCFEPLLLYIYDPKNNSFHVQKFEEDLVFLEQLNNTSSCCNGDNKLFVSGGNDNNGNIIDKLWIFDLIDYNVEDPIQILGKNNHSMIYIPKKYVFIVGGNDENVYYLDIETKKVENWGCLNKKRIEPALLMVNNYLYAFDNINKNEDNNIFELSFEKTNLLSSTPSWEEIQPELSRDILGNKIIPKFFGISKESDNKIIFLGGTILDENDNLEGVNNYIYNLDNNMIEISEVPFVNIALKEKKFLSFNNKNDVFYILPDFYKKCPQVVFYIKHKNKIKLIDYRPNSKSGKMTDDLNKNNLRVKNYDFNMPKPLDKNENEIGEIKNIVEI